MGIIAEIHKDLELGAVHLIAEYRSRLQAVAVKLCGDEALANDLVFRTFERVIAKIDSYKTDDSFFGWMTTIMENLHRNDVKRPVVRGTKSVPSEELEQLAGEDWSTDEQILRNSDGEAVRAALSNLDPKYKQVLILRFYEDLSLKEIAEFLNKPVGTVSRRIHVALHLLAGKLEAEFGKAKKSLALLGAILLGATTLFGAYQTGLVDAVKSYFTSEPLAAVVETPVAAPAPIVEDSESTETVASSAPPAAKTAAVSSVPTAEPANIEPETTTSETNEKENNEMNLTKTVKTAALSAAVMLGAVNMAEAEGEEYLLTVNADAAGQVQVTANGEKGAAGSSVELSLTNGSPVIVEYIPNVAGQGRFFTGAPASADVSTLNKISFAMAGERTINVSEFAYSDDYVFSTDATLVQKNPYEGRVVYVFTNTASSALLYARVPLYYEEALSVAGGGGGSGTGASYMTGALGGGGAGGLLFDSSPRSFAAGASLSLKVGAGGAANAKGQNTTFALGDILLECIGGGAANSWQANSPAACNGGSGGGCGNLSGGSGTPGQGFNGGAKNSLGCGSGGGGASAAGGDAVSSGGVGHGGNGGDGRWDAITGELRCYASGGGGWAGSSAVDENGNYLMEPGHGGADSGGCAGVAALPEPNPKGYTLDGQNGVDGLGGGGGGGYTNDGGAGGDGAVIVAFSIEASPEKRFSFDEFASYPIVGTAAEPSPEIRCGEAVLTESDDYDLYYENNTSNGARAKMVIVGKGDYAGVVMRHTFTPTVVYCVKPEGTGDGKSWANATSLQDAVAALATAPGEIWCAAGEYDVSGIDAAGLSLPCATAIRGGFAADDADIAKKETGAKSLFNGGGTAQKIFDVTVSVGAAYFGEKEVVFEDCAFTGVADSAIRVYQKATPVAINRCVFTNNTTTVASMGGILNFYECSKAPVTIADCVFRENYWNRSCGDRRAVLLARGVKLTVDRSVFEQNCKPPTDFTANTVWTETSIIDLYGNDQWSEAIAVDADIRDCVFLGNFIARHYANAFLIYAHDRVNANIERCRFVGNSLIYSTWESTGRLTAIINSVPRSNYKVLINNCTFAYNALNNHTYGSSIIVGGSTADSQTEIKNCIFWGNRCRADNAYKRDLHLGTAATVQYCLFEDTTKDVYVNIELDETNIAGDPAFVSGDVMDDLTVMSGSNVILNKDKLDDIHALDVHLLSPEAYSKNDGTRVTGGEDAPLSPAIDKGDPAADYSNEPNLNGNRLNLGCYGNTAEASETPFCDPAIESVVADFPDGLTQLRLTMGVGGVGAFVGTVVFYVSTDGGETYTASEPISSVKNGDVVRWSAPFYADPGATLKYYATLSAAGADPDTMEIAETTVTGAKPPWEKPGDVVLVTPEGTPAGSGQSWASPIDIMTAVNGLVKNPGTEIWCAAGEYDLSELPTTGLVLSRMTAIRGGFAADDADIAKKEMREKSLFNGGGVAPLIFDVTVSVGTANFESEQILFEDCVFTGIADSAIRVYQKATPVTISRCVFTNNTTTVASMGGVLNFYGCSKAPVTVTNCVFRENYWDAHCGDRRSVLLARGANLTVDRCVFEQNCKPPTNISPTTDWTENSIIDLYGGGNDVSQLVTADIRDCAFQGNFISRQYGPACIINATGYVNANIEHCRFVGNSFLGYHVVERANAIINSMPNANYKVSINNCTFAYNALNNDKYGIAVVCGASTANSLTEIKNCIFWGNRCRADNAYKRDLQLGSAATVKYCLFEDKTLDKYVNIELDETNIAGDPKFISGDVMGKLTATSGSDIILNKDKLGEILALDVHLERKSPAVNKGDPKSDWSKEPKPNGKRINMGAYGGTPEAACTRPGGALIIR